MVLYPTKRRKSINMLSKVTYLHSVSFPVTMLEPHTVLIDLMDESIEGNQNKTNMSRGLNREGRMLRNKNIGDS